MKIDERTKKQVYMPVFVAFGLLFLLVTFLLGKKIMNRGTNDLPNWAREYRKPKRIKGKAGGSLMPASLPPIKIDKVERRRYRR
ncbi:MAG: hypothetical protein COB53_08435, partial [Elusimicrobia bacterium]